jgi:hypothetical protein
VGAIRRETPRTIFVERALERLRHRFLRWLDARQVTNTKRSITSEHIGKRANDPWRKVVDQPPPGLSDNRPCLAEDGVIRPN